MDTKPKYTTVDEFMALQSDEARKVLEKLRGIIKQVAPKADEVISYAIPAFKLNSVIVWYAPSKNHYAIYARPKILEMFKTELAAFKGTKSAIHFSYDQPMPVKLIRGIVKASVKEDGAKAQVYGKGKSKAKKK